VSVWFWCSRHFNPPMSLQSTKHDLSFWILISKFEGWKGRHFCCQPRATFSLATPSVSSYCQSTAIVLFERRKQYLNSLHRWIVARFGNATFKKNHSEQFFSQYFFVFENKYFNWNFVWNRKIFFWILHN